MQKSEWYVVQSKPQKESLVCAQLRSASDGVEVFFPKLRNRMGIRPLFPSYLFINVAMSNVENYRLVKYTRGVLRILESKEDGPIPVADEIIETIRQRTGPNDLIDQRKFFSLGTSVRIRRGPLKDLVGILEKFIPDGERVQILFRLLKYPLRAAVKFEDLEIV